MTKGTKSIVVVAITLSLVALAVFVVLWLQLSDTREQLSEQIASLQTERQQEEDRVQLQRTANETADEREMLAGYFLAKESESIDFLNYIESVAPQAGVQLSTTDLQVVEGESETVDWLQVNFKYDGTREAVLRFTEVLETAPYISSLESVNMRSLSSDTWTASVVMKVQLMRYENS